MPRGRNTVPPGRWRATPITQDVIADAGVIHHFGRKQHGEPNTLVLARATEVLVRRSERLSDPGGLGEVLTAQATPGEVVP